MVDLTPDEATMELYHHHDTRLEKGTREWYLDRHRRRRGVIPGSGKAARYAHIAHHVPVSIADILCDRMPKYVESEYRYYCRSGPLLCVYCSCRLDKTNRTVDHLVPRARGGSHLGPENLVHACASCNRAKGHDSLLHYLVRRKISSGSSARRF